MGQGQLIALIMGLLAFVSPIGAVDSQLRAPSQELRLPDELAKELQRAEEKGEGLFAAKFTQMLTTLALIIALLFVVLWVIKRFVQAKIDVTNRQSRIKILETRPLSAKTVLYLVEIDGTQHTLADSPGGVTQIR